MAARISFCSFNKFGFCKYGGKCRKTHYSEICEQSFCENIKYCEKRHPRRCYFYCAYGFCKFGNNCQFRHEHQHSKPPAKKDTRLEEENRVLKKELFEVNEKHESLKVQLDNLMENQLKNEDRNKDSVANEIDTFKNKFVHGLKEKNIIIDNQARTIADLALETVKLKQENFKNKQIQCYTCDICDFETEEKQNLSSHKEINHEHLSEN
jgi:hypothetical protein